MLFVAVYVSVCGLLKERNLFAFIFLERFSFLFFFY